MKKRVLTMLLALILVLAALPVASLAAEPETEPPKLVGNLAIQDGGTYYLSLVVAVADEDEDLTKVTLNGEDVDIDDPYTVALPLEGNKEATYKIHAEDKAGNVLDATLYMKPLKALLVGLDGVTEENVNSSHLEAVQTAEQALLDQAGLFEEDFCPQSEMDELLALVKQCEAMEKKIHEVQQAMRKIYEGMGNLPDLNKDTRAQYEALQAEIQTLLDGQNLTDSERFEMKALGDSLTSLLKALDMAQEVLAKARVTAAKTLDTVTSDDLEELQTTVADLKDVLSSNFYLTDEEKEEAAALIQTCVELEKRIHEVEAALDKLAQDIDALPAPTKDSKEQYEAVLAQTQALLDGNNLTDEEREALEELRDVLETVVSDLETVQEVLAQARVTAAKDPKTVKADDLDELKAVEYNLGIILQTTYLTDAEREEATSLLEKVTELRKLAEKAAEEPKPTEPKPTEPTKPADPTNPATGDGMNVALSVALCLAAAIGLAGVAITRKKF